MISSRKSKLLLTTSQKNAFRKIVYNYYHTHGRHDLPWRNKISPYRVIVSEIMLQQTQVDRVIPFFMNWMKLFPTLKKLTEAPQTEVLRAWKGLGYNSRALRLKKTAEIITRDYHGKFPKTYEELILLPGIGPYTAGALCAFAYNQPVTMIETNIRRVYLHHFYPSPLREVPLNKGSQDIDTISVHDRELLQLIQQTLDDEHPREWYWALMDYGAYLGKTIPNPNKKSRHYTVQKKFEGSDRQLRGKILEYLLAQKNHRLTMKKIQKLLEPLTRDGDRIEIILDQLSKDGFLEIAGNSIILKR